VSRLVLDASVAIKWLLPASGENLAAEALALYERYTRGKFVIAVPDLFWAETANALCNAARRGRITRLARESSFQELRRFDFATVNSLMLIDRAFELATRFGQTVYDCLYVALAIESEAELITADERLANALGAHVPVRWLGAI